MIENEHEEELERDDEFSHDEADHSADDMDHVVRVKGMYNEYFLDYASYVILERAVPHQYDGLKPVQRRILHSLNEMDDGRFHKVANVIGNTMKYHPHGDASIGDAMVQIGQKDLLLDCQGNWGNILTGDRAAAPRYIEVRLSKFGNTVLFNKKTTTWLSSYDGRNQEPETQPVKFPLLLAQGVEGIAVGLACKMLPHNFNELIDASIATLNGKRFNLVPDFPTGGMADVEQYNDGFTTIGAVDAAFLQARSVHSASAGFLQLRHLSSSYRRPKVQHLIYDRIVTEHFAIFAVVLRVHPGHFISLLRE